MAYGARAQGLRNLVVTAKGRERTYTEHFKRARRRFRAAASTRRSNSTAFPISSSDDVQERCSHATSIFVPNRSFEVYLHQKFGYDEIERGMRVPFFGNRFLLRAEERDEPANQYALMERAGIRYPRQFAIAATRSTGS